MVFEPRLVRAGRGWMRVGLRGWSGGSPRRLAKRIERIAGVRDVEANARTARVLIRFDPRVTDEVALLAALATPLPAAAGAADEDLDRDATDVPPALVSREGTVARARIAVRGLERDQDLARRVVERLRHLRGVRRVSASPLTGRVLVEFAVTEIELADLLEQVGLIELPTLPGEDRPAHPLEREPLLQSGSRLIGAAVGLGVLAARGLVGRSGPPTSRGGPAEAAALLGVAEGFPRLKAALRAVLGPRGAEFTFAAATVGALTLSGSTLGLAVSGLGALRAFTEMRERQRAWRRYERRTEHFPPVAPGVTVRVEGGERVPLAGAIVDGVGTGVAADGTLVRIEPGGRVEAGMRLHGGSFTVALEADPPFVPHAGDGAADGGLLPAYLEAVPWLALGYAALTWAVTRSLGRAFIAFVVVNPRAALATTEASDLGASARVLRAGVTVVGARRRPLCGVDVLLIDGARPLVDGYELASVDAGASGDPRELVDLAAKIAGACGSPWPRAFSPARVDDVDAAAYARGAASGTIGGDRFVLAPVDEERLRDGPELVLELRREGEAVGVLVLRPRPAPGLDELRRCCERLGVELQVTARAAGVNVAARNGLVADERDLLALLRHHQDAGRRVAVASDSAHAAPAFAEADLALGLASGRSGRFSAQVDLLAPDLGALAAILEAGARRDRAVRDGTILALVGNAAGSVWVLRRRPVLQRAAYPLYLAALAGLGAAWLRMRGGERPLSLATIADPRPERWGRLDPAEVLRAFETTRGGLSAREAAKRRREELLPGSGDHRLLGAVGAQLRSPLTALLAVGAGLSYAVGARADVAVIAAVVGVNCLVGAWQETEAAAAADALERRTTTSARVRRDGELVSVPAAELVAGDVLVLAPGDRVAADARLLEAQGLEVDEAPLTGESLPVVKQVEGGPAESRVLLAGCDITVGRGEAVAIAVGDETRIGATGAALALAGERRAGLDERLSRMLRQALPVSLAGGAFVLASGFLWRRPLRPQLAVAASIAIAALPEGLPLLAGVAEAAVARRLAHRQALVRRLGAVEALGRVDVACVDKTGTLTEGRLAVGVVADVASEGEIGPALPARLRRVLMAAVGFVGISDPLRAGVRAAVERCHEAGVRVVMLTGDHPATAFAVAREAGLANRQEQVAAGDHDGDVFDHALETATVIARVTPVDKVQIIERLQQRGHVVAMTGDGVNDAPALRLADVGVAMGEGGTDVAREAADVVLADDNFTTLVEALVEGRGFWQNMRRALGLLLGGNLGEVGLIVAATMLGRPSPLTPRQILAVNLVTDVLPAVAVAVQAPAHRDLSNLAREGLAALDEPLRRDVVRRGFATALPSLAATLAIAHRGGSGQVQTTAFGSIVATQLAQTWQLGRSADRLSRPVAGAVAGSTLMMLASVALPPLRAFLGLAVPTRASIAAIGLAALAAIPLAQQLLPALPPPRRALVAGSATVSMR